MSATVEYASCKHSHARKRFDFVTGAFEYLLVSLESSVLPSTPSLLVFPNYLNAVNRRDTSRSCRCSWARQPRPRPVLGILSPVVPPRSITELLVRLASSTRSIVQNRRPVCGFLQAAGFVVRKGEVHRQWGRAPTLPIRCATADLRGITERRGGAFQSVLRLWNWRWYAHVTNTSS